MKTAEMHTAKGVMKIEFFHEDIDLPSIDLNKVSEWLDIIAQKHGNSLKGLNYIFCSNDYLLQVNIDYLDHHYHTDIITFDNSEEDGEIEGDVFISLDQVSINAKEYGESNERELLRVIAHGLLHLIGFNDKTDEQQEEMSRKEEECLDLFMK